MLYDQGYERGYAHGLVAACDAPEESHGINEHWLRGYERGFRYGQEDRDWNSQSLDD